MSSPIQIVVTAETAQAAQNIRDFAAKVNNSLNDVGKGAQEAGVHIAGMSYYFRSGIDAIRTAAAGGGARAGFYAIDEAVRGLISSGMKIGTLIPILGSLSAAVGAGALVWKTFSDATHETEDRVKSLAEAFKELPAAIQQLSDLKKTGLISPAAASEYHEMLTKGTQNGKPLYIDDKGQISTSSTHTESRIVDTGVYAGGLPSGKTQGVEEVVPSKLATADEIRTWVQKQSTAGGNITPEQLAASLGLQTDEREIVEAGMSPAEKAVAEIKDRFRKVREQLQKDLAVAGATVPVGEKKSFTDWLLGLNPAEVGKVGVLSPEKLAAAQDALRQSYTDESNAIAKKTGETQLEAQKKLAAQYKQEWEKANKELDIDITNEALQSGKTREQLYAQEYIKRGALVAKFWAEGKLSAQDCWDAILQAQTKALKDEKQVTEELRRQAQLKQEIARGKIESKATAIQTDPLLNEKEKAEALVPVYQQLIGLDNQRIQDLQKIAAGPDQAASLDAQHQMVGLYSEIARYQNEIKAAGESPIQKWITDIKDMSQAWNVAQTDILNGITQNGSGLNGTISQGLTAVATGTKTWGQASKEMARSVVTEAISGFIQMGMEYIQQLELMLAKYIATKLTETAVTQTTNTTKTASNTTSAIPAAIAGLFQSGAEGGWIGLGIYVAMLAATIGAVAAMAGGAFAAGGRPEPGTVNLVGEQGPELFIPDSAGTILSNADTMRMLSGSRAAGASPVGSSGPATVNLTVGAFNSRSDWERHARSAEGEQVWLDMATKHAGRFQRRS